MAILQDFEAHQEEILHRLRGSWLPVYVRLVSSLLPKAVDISLPDFQACSEAEIARKVLDARAPRSTCIVIEVARDAAGTRSAVLLGEAEPMSGL